MKSFVDKVVVVTGAASGIGRALARAFASEGAHLALMDRDAAGLRDTMGLLAGADHMSQDFDIADRTAVRAFRDAVIAHFGHVDIVINNAGVAHSQTVSDCSYEDFEWIMGINFWGMVYGTKEFLPDLLAREEAAVVNISSIFGMIAVPTQSTYNATKFGIRGFTEALRHEMEQAGRPLHVMSVHPGGIRTNIARNARFYVGPDGEDHDTGISQFDRLARTTPEQAAGAILKGLRKRQLRCLIGFDAKMVDLIQRLFPVSYFRILHPLIRRRGD